MPPRVQFAVWDGVALGYIAPGQTHVGSRPKAKRICIRIMAHNLTLKEVELMGNGGQLKVTPDLTEKVFSAERLFD